MKMFKSCSRHSGVCLTSWLIYGLVVWFMCLSICSLIHRCIGQLVDLLMDCSFRTISRNILWPVLVPMKSCSPWRAVPQQITVPHKELFPMKSCSPWRAVPQQITVPHKELVPMKSCSPQRAVPNEELIFIKSCSPWRDFPHEELSLLRSCSSWRAVPHEELIPMKS